MRKTHCLFAAMLASLASGALAHQSAFINVNVLQPIPQIRPLAELFYSFHDGVDRPKLWKDMTTRERADIWPHLSPRMQHHYWTCMPRQERRAMYRLLSTHARLALRYRFVFQDHHYSMGAIPPHLTSHPVPHHPPRLSPEQRARLRAQILDMHPRHSHPRRHHIPD